ncbi:MAG: hypothetical protein M1838_003342 [Thelocarpon superellum]|nr:MAG: hypothetical protein M1838_003342 [Thelocarpon superellum]
MTDLLQTTPPSMSMAMASTRFLPHAFHPPRTPSRSPSRAHHIRIASRELNPLLAQLSPAATLEALAAAPAASPIPSPPRGQAQSPLEASIAQASLTERTFGSKAAVAANEAHTWFAELSSWAWSTGTTIDAPNGFDEPAHQERARKRRKLSERQSRGGATEPDASVSTPRSPGVEEEYWGSLTAPVVRAHEARLQAIKRGIDRLDVEGLKQHVLDVHVPSRSRPSSSRADEPFPSASSPHPHLDDFTAVTTATVLQTLPFLARLTSLLDTWTLRFAVLRKVPAFLDELEDARTALDEAWRTLKSEVHIARSEFGELRMTLEAKVKSLGQQLDSMLDLLEGRRDTIPDRWIETMEALEKSYASWVVEAEGYVLECEFRQLTASESVKKSSPRPPAIVTDLLGAPAARPDDAQRLPSPVSRFSPTSTIADAADLSTREGPSRTISIITTASLESTGYLDHHNPPMLKSEWDADSPLSPVAGDFFASAIEPNPTLAEAANGPPRTPIRGTAEGREKLYESGASEKLIDMRYHAFKSIIAPREADAPCADGGATTTPPGSNERTSPRPSLTSKYNVQPSSGSISEALGPAPNIRSSVQDTFGSPKSKVNGRTEQHGLVDAPGDTSSRPSTPESPLSSAFSDCSSPEVEDASTASFVLHKPVMVASRPTSSVGTPTLNHMTPSMTPMESVSRNSSLSQRAVNVDGLGEHEVLERFPLKSRWRSRSLLLENPPSQPETPRSVGPDKEDVTSRAAKRASVTSIEMVQKGGVKSIEVRRRGGGSPTSLTTPVNRRSESMYIRTPTSPALSEMSIASRSPSVFLPSPRASTEPMGGLPSQPSSDYFGDSADRLPPPIPQRSHRRMSGVSVDVPSSPASRVVTSPPGSASAGPNLEIQAHPTNAEKSDDPLDQRINSILTTIPAQIRLTSEEGDATNGKNYARAPRDRSTSSLRLPRSSTPSFTLARAYGKTQRPARTPSSSSGAEVRLYHLRRTAGTEAPLKLFVRQVGDNGERVMVRVGGGWADLGEYLREYAIHHGRRSVSDGRMEILDIATPTSTGFSSVRGSARATPSSSRPGSAQSVRPGSELHVRKIRAPSYSSPITASVLEAYDSSPTLPPIPLGGSNGVGGFEAPVQVLVRPQGRTTWHLS